MGRCVDCPDLPNGVRKRLICCKREGGRRFQIGETVPHGRPLPDIRPAFTGAGKTSFKPSRHGKRAPGR